ncbi:MAG: type II toxin-antitoxin system MqsR family toxin [Spirochaetota bacterium]
MLEKVEKDTPKYKLNRVVELIQNNNFRITQYASDTAIYNFNLEKEDIVKEIIALKGEHFLKSTKDINRPGWQDAYAKKIKGVEAYIKITIQNGELLVIISFKKKKENG